MKTKTILLFLSLMPLAAANAQNQQDLNSGFSFGGHIAEYQNDFGIGLNLTTPRILKTGPAFRLRGNMMYHQHLLDTTSTWSPYTNLSFGVIGYSTTLSDRIRIYGEGGVTAILPSDRFSEKKFNLGGYGLFGFEFYFFHAGNYFIEIGGMGTGAVADKIPGKPIYSNGLTVSAGFRFVLPTQAERKG